MRVGHRQCSCGVFNSAIQSNGRKDEIEMLAKIFNTAKEKDRTEYVWFNLFMLSTYLLNLLIPIVKVTFYILL